MRTILSSSDAQLSTGTPYWPQHNPSPHRYPRLTIDLTCDVAVVGGGISGSLIAYRLAKAGLSTILLDKGRFATGSTRASTALISYEFDFMLSELSTRIGEKAAIRAYQLCFEATSKIKQLVHELEDPCDYQDKVAIRVSNNGPDFKDLERESKIRNKHDMPTELIGKDDLQQRYGITAAVGLVSTNAVQVDPFKLTHLLVSRATHHGLQAFEGTRVTAFESTKSELEIATAQGSKVRAKHVIFATGYESEKYLGKTKATLTTDYAFISHQIQNLGKLEKCHMVENADDYLYLSTFGDRVMVGLEGKSFHYPAERTRHMAHKVKQIQARLAQYLPDLDPTPEYHWASTFANSPDSLPYIGTSPKFPGAYFALGYGGNGIASNATLAPILQDLVEKGKSPDAKLFSLDR